MSVISRLRTIRSRRRVKHPRIGVIGGGSWATALVKVLLDNGHKVNWWMRRAESARFVRRYRHNPNYLSSVWIDTRRCKVSERLLKVTQSSDILVLAVPSAFLKDTLAPLKAAHLKKKVMVSAVKGIIPDSNQLVAEFLHARFAVPYEQIVVIAGPSHAEEVAQEKLSYLTLACRNEAVATKVAGLLDCRYIKTSVTDDIYGTEYTAVLKNVVSVASGICHGLGYGDNFQAVLISNAIQEIKRFVDAVHPIDRDIMGSAYLGDLLVTAYSQYSRNRTFGSMIGKGYPVRSAQMEMNMVAEGYYAVKCIHEINRRYRVDMPITGAAYDILYGHAAPAVRIRELAEQLR